MNSPHQQRALLLLEQQRAALAEQELRLAIADDPENAFSHALLCLCLADQEKWDQAEQAAGAAIRLEPDQPFPHFARARLELARERPGAAEAAIREAITLDPYDPDQHAVLAAAHLARRRWTDALEAADRGLAVDPEHVACTNLRASALVHLGRKVEAGAALGQALNRDPENSYTHANQGWALLHRAEPRAAVDHFREALRLDPENDTARGGLIEALKARNPLYGLMLRYFLWMGRLQPRTQWLVIIGGWFLYRAARGVARSNPEMAPLMYPLMGAYVLFVLLSWTADYIFDLLLYLNPIGRHALSAQERRAAQTVGGAMLVALAAITVAVSWRNDDTFNAALMAGLLVLPTAGVFRLRPGTGRRRMTIATAGMYAAALLSLAFSAAAGPGGDQLPGNLLFLLVILGAVASTWIVNISATRLPR